MDKDAKKLMVSFGDTYFDIVRPTYEIYLEQLLANLALSQHDVKNLRGEHEDGTDNGSSIRQFCDTLPKATIERVENLPVAATFVGQLDVLLRQQAAALFRKKPTKDSDIQYDRGPMYEDVSELAYYVIGANERTHEILAYEISGTDEEDEDGSARIIRFTPFIRDKANKEPLWHRQKRLLSQCENEIAALYDSAIDDLDGYKRLGMTPTEADRMAKELYVRKTGSLILTVESTGSKVLPPIHAVSTRFSTETNAYVGFDESEQGFVSDQEMIDFDIPSHLSRLSTMFNKKDELSAAFLGHDEGVDQPTLF